MFRRSALALVLGLGFASTSLDVAFAVSPPPPPKTGPGAVIDATTDVVKRAIGKVGEVNYVYHLAAAPAEPRSVVVVLHAWGASNPVVYGAWIEHLARRGHLVVFPGFQEVGVTKPSEATDRAGALLKQALAELASDPQAKPDPAKVFLLAHSAGVGVAMNLAARAKTLGIPAPRLIFATMAGGIAKDAESKGIALDDLSGVDAATVVVTMTGDRENLVADRNARRILKEASAVPIGRKLFMRSGSDDHGFPAMTATIASPAGAKEGYGSDTVKLPVEPAPPEVKGQRVRRPPAAPRPKWSADAQLSGEQRVLLQQLQRNTVDSLDYAYWRVFDMLAIATLAGGDMVALRQDPAFLEMGRWSDGWPVRRLAAETPRAADATATPSAAPAATGPVIQSKQPVTRRPAQRRQR